MRSKSFLLSKSLLTATLLLSTTNIFANITIDGAINDWEILEQINLPTNLPPALATGDAIYGQYITTPEAAYIFAIKTAGAQIGANTTFWLNTDNNVETGFKIWDTYGGAEFFVNVDSGDNLPYLYDSTGAFVTGPLEHS